MNLKEIIADIRRDPDLLDQKEIILACLNRACHSMLECAFFLPAEGEPQQMYQETTTGDDSSADAVVIRFSETGDDLVAFHEARPNSRDYLPNGIRLHREKLDFPCVVFCNSGRERVTVDGEKVLPGSYTFVRERDIRDPEVQRALEEFVRSPAVTAAVEEVRSNMQERKGR